jgi:urease accessory protein
MQISEHLALPATAPSPSDVLAGNRAVGRIALTVVGREGSSERGRVHEAGMLRVRFPNDASRDTLNAVIINSAGGMTGGDRSSIDLKVEAGAQMTVTTAAAEKIYRSLATDTQVDVKLTIGTGGALTWLPQETILFDQARLRRAIDVDVAAGASLLLSEAIVFGRTAMNESVVSGYLFDRWRVRVDGALVFAETVRLDGRIAERLAVPAIGGGCVAIATLMSVPGNDETVAAVRAAQESFIGEVGASAWNGFAVVRLIAADGAALRRDLIGVLRALGAPLPRLWLN